MEVFSRACQFEAHPLCSWCLQQGKIAVATIADGVLSPADDAFHSLCRECYGHKHAPNPFGYIDDIGYADDIGLDGYPVDMRHPFNQPRLRG